MTLRAVIFDWGGTLTPWHTVDAQEAWLAATGDADLAARLGQAEDAVWLRSRDEHRSATLSDVVAAAGADARNLVLDEYHRWWVPHTYTDPDVPELLRALRSRRLRVGVLSNTLWSREHHEAIFARDGVLELIDGAIYTSEIPWTKPHPEAFRAALASVGVTNPTDAVFVGDRPYDDIHGAKAIGMRAVLVPHSTIPEVQRVDVDAQPDAVIARLSELVGIIDAWR